MDHAQAADRQSTTALLERLVAFETTCYNPNLTPIDRDYQHPRGIACRVDSDPLPDREPESIVRPLVFLNSAGKTSRGAEGSYLGAANSPNVLGRAYQIAQTQHPDDWSMLSESQACDRFSRRLADRLPV